MIEIPLAASPNQSCMVTLDDQDCTIAVYQRNRNTYLDLYVDDTAVRTGAVCLPATGIVGNVTCFTGELVIVDTGSQPDNQQMPQWSGLGTRWKLYYLSTSELESLNG